MCGLFSVFIPPLRVNFPIGNLAHRNVVSSNKLWSRGVLKKVLIFFTFLFYLIMRKKTEITKDKREYIKCFEINIYKIIV